MAGDWIKMRSDLHTHPKVVRISSALQADKLRTIGGLHSAWCLFDVHTTDGRLDGYTPQTLDDYLGFPGFAQAMIDVGWLIFDGGRALVMPRFDEHNGHSAKKRAQDAQRKKYVRKMSASETDKCPPDKRTSCGQNADQRREEERREEGIGREGQPAQINTKTEDNPLVGEWGYEGTAKDTFDAFWAIYPNKQRKIQAWSNWSNLFLINTDLAQDGSMFATLFPKIMDAVRAWLPEWAALGMQKVPLACNWISEKRWTEVPLSSNRQSSKPKEESIEDRMKRIREANTNKAKT